MKKRMQTIIILSGICLLVFAGYGISLQMQGGSDTEETGGTESLWDFSKEEVVQMDYQYEGEEIALKKEDGIWQYSADAEFPLNQEKAKQMEDAVNAVETLRTIEAEKVDAAAFGLDNPGLTLSVTDASGAEHELFIGNYNSAAGGYYAQDGEQAYVIAESVVKAFSYGLYELLVLDEIPQVDAEYVNGISLCVDSAVRTYTCKVEETEEETTQTEEESTASDKQNVWYVSENDGEEQKVSEEEMTEYVNKILAISSKGAVNYHADGEEELRTSYGIGENYLEVSYLKEDSEETKSYRIFFGNKDGDCRYMTVDDSMMVQLVEDSDLFSW